MERTPTNIIASFFYYMWNKWSKEECLIVFGESGISHHIWNKWQSLSESHFKGATERLFAELDDESRELLINRAIALYNGRNRKF